MKKLRTRAREYGPTLIVRKDRRRSKPRMTKAGYMTAGRQLHADRTGYWKEWWYYGCGRWPNGTAFCPPGHAYQCGRWYQGAHRKTKIAGRRAERRQNKRTMEED